MTAATILWPAAAGLHGLMALDVWQLGAAGGVAAFAGALGILVGVAVRGRRK